MIGDRFPTRVAEFSLDWPPSVNTYWRSAVYGRVPVTHLTHKARDYRKRCVEALGNLAGRVGDERLAVSILAFPPDRRTRDLDNILKPILDVLQHAGLVEDDSVFDRITIERGPIAKPGRVELELWAGR